MHASDPSIQLVVIILETMLIAFRFSYKIAAKLKVLGIFNLHRAHYLGPKVGKSNMCRLLTGYFGSGKPSSVRSRVWNFPNADSVKTIFRRGTKMNSGSYHIWFSHFGLILELFLPADPPQTPPHHRYLVGEAERAPSSSPDVLGQGWISEITTGFLGFGHARSSTKQKHSFLMAIWHYPMSYDRILPFIRPVALVDRNSGLASQFERQAPDRVYAGYDVV